MLYWTSAVKQLFKYSNANTVSGIQRRVGLRYRSDGVKVVLVGGQRDVEVNLALMLKKNNHFSEICIYDSNSKNLKGVCTDLNYIHTPSTVTYHEGNDALEESLQNANLVMVLDQNSSIEGNPKLATPEAMEAMLFKVNADLCSKVAEAYATICPGAILAVAAQPINSMTPLIYSIASKLNHNVTVNRVVGFTLKDGIQANILLAKKLGKPVNEIRVPIIGGSSRNTIIPLLSAVKDAGNMSKDEVKSFIEELRKENGNQLTGQSSPLSSASALYRFANSLAMAFKGQEVFERSYVACDLAPGCKFFAGNARFGPAGLQIVEPLPQLSEYEQALYQSAIFHLRIDMRRADDFVEHYLLFK